MYNTGHATKTDGTAWSWGASEFGSIGNNENTTERSSPVQIPGTNWIGPIIGFRNTANTAGVTGIKQV